MPAAPVADGSGDGAATPAGGVAADVAMTAAVIAPTTIAAATTLPITMVRRRGRPRRTVDAGRAAPPVGRAGGAGRRSAGRAGGCPGRGGGPPRGDRIRSRRRWAAPPAIG